MIKRIVITLVVLAVPLLSVLLFTYEVINIEFTSFMEDQISVRNQEGPVIPFVEEAIPFDGVAYVPGGRPPQNPYPGDPASIARGKEYYAINCAVCHGEAGPNASTVGPVGTYFDPPPPLLTTELIRQRDDATLFLRMTEGFGRMPRMVENLTENERWDVVNYLRSLAQQ